jgi:hypothetical protein
MDISEMCVSLNAGINFGDRPHETLDFIGYRGACPQNFDAGAMIPGAGGVRKIRWVGSGRGKRGGARLIYYWNFGDKILMLYVYLKNERDNLTEEQKRLMKQIAEEYKHE